MSKPLIQLIKSPNSCYFYDTNCNEIVEIDNAVFCALQNIMDNSDDLQTSCSEKLNYLKDIGYLTEQRIKKIEHPMTEFLEYFLMNKIEKITLQITQECNFRCTYCLYSESNDGHQRKHSNSVMSKETAMKAVDFLYNHSRDSEKVNIGFYGGEPLLKYQLIKDIVFYAKHKFINKELTFNITTNGSLINDEIVEFCLQNNIHLLLSFDGPKEIQDKNRRFACNGNGTYDIILNKIQSITSRYPEFAKLFGINTVIDPQNDYDCLNTFFMEYEIFRKIQVKTTVIDDTYLTNKVLYTDDYIMKNEYNLFVAFLNYFGYIDDKYVSLISKEILSRFINDKDNLGRISMPEIFAPSGPCLPGVLRTFVDANGQLFPCERCSENSKAMCIGTLDSGFNTNQAKRILNIGQITDEKCRNCWAILHCKICASKIEDGNDFSKQKKLEKCKEMYNEVFYNILTYIMLYEVENLYMRNNYE